MLADGHTVEVASPQPSAAHHHFPDEGLAVVVRLARLARRHDGLRVRLEPGTVISAEPRRGQQALELTALRLVLAAWADSVLDVGDGRLLASPPSGALRLLLRAAGRVVVATDYQRRAVLAAGVPAERIDIAEEHLRSCAAPSRPPETEAPPVAAPPSAPPAPFLLGADPSRAQLQEAIAARAAHHRAARREPVGTGIPTADLALRRLGPLGPPPRWSHHVAGKVGRGIVSRLTAWQTDHFVAHVNTLHAAAAESIDQLAARCDQRSDTGQGGTS